MTVRKNLRLVCPLIAATCLGIGYSATVRWIAVVVGILQLLAWLFAIKWSFGILTSSVLVLSVCLAAVGVLIGAMPLWMILSAAFTLAGWDVILWNRTLPIHSLSTSLSLIERKHYQNLGMALGFGLLVVVPGQLLRLHIPFGWMVVLVIITLISLERTWHTLID